MLQFWSLADVVYLGDSVSFFSTRMLALLYVTKSYEIELNWNSCQISDHFSDLSLLCVQHFIWLVIIVNATFLEIGINFSYGTIQFTSFSLTFRPINYGLV